MENKDMPAFPVHADTINRTGLTKREQLAAMMDVRQDIADYSLGFLTQLVGRERPSSASPHELIKWDAEAEAVIRIIKADALLDELSKS